MGFGVVFINRGNKLYAHTFALSIKSGWLDSHLNV